MKRYITVIILLLAFISFPKSVFAINGVAQINDKEYESLIDAIEAVAPNETITLLQDVSFADQMETYYVAEIPDGVTIDLNKKDLTIGWDDINGIGNLIFTGTNIVIKNGSISGRPDYVLWLGDVVETNGVIIENVTVNGGINVYNALGIVLKNVTVVGHNYYAIWNQASEITINSGHYSTNGENGLLGVSDSDYLENGIVIKGGIFEANGNKLYSSKTPLNALVIESGIFNVDVQNLISNDLESKLLYDFYVVRKKDTDVILDTEITSKEEQNEVTFSILNSDNIHRNLLESIYEFGEVNIENKNIKMKINVNKIQVSENEEKEFKKVLSENATNAKLYNFFNIYIDVIDTDKNQSLGNLTELKNKITFEISLPEQKIERTYYVIRKHNNKMEILDSILSEDKKSLTFETDQFSTYALAYVEKLENPDTSDNILFYVSLATITFISFIGFCLYCVKDRKRLSL